METRTCRRKPIIVEEVQVTEQNMAEVAEWCGGEIRTNENTGDKFIKVRVSFPRSDRQTEAYLGDHVLKFNGFKVYQDEPFNKMWEPLDEPLPIEV